MAWTSTDIDTIEAAIRQRLSGNIIERYSVQDLDITYTSLKDLYALRDRMVREVAEADPANATVLASFHRAG